MTPTLVDSNVLLDIATENPEWHSWSSEALERAADRALLVINPLIYSEVSVGFERVEDLESVLPQNSSAVSRSPGRARFLRARPFSPIVAAAAPEVRRCRTSI